MVAIVIVVLYQYAVGEEIPPVPESEVIRPLTIVDKVSTIMEPLAVIAVT